MWLRPTALVLLLAMQAMPGFAADLKVLERELERLSYLPGDAAAPGESTLSLLERRARLQEQAEAMRKALDNARRVIIVNVPAYTLTAYEDGQPVLESKVIVGSVTRRTPLIETQVAAVQLNPAWNAPPTVVKGDLTRNGRIDPRAVRQKGLTVLDAEGNPLSAEDLAELSAEQSRSLRFYQPPGERNALGQVKVMLKGIPDIYLHDTPNKKLFGKSKRALSSGCVRVDKARELAAWLTGKSLADIDRLIDAGATRTVAVPATQVIVGYWLADTAGERAVLLDDIYRLAAQRPAPAMLTAEPAAAKVAIAAVAAPVVNSSASTPATSAGNLAAITPAATPTVPPPATAPAAAQGVAPARREEAAIASAPPRRALITPANSAPWVGGYVRSALAGLDLRGLRMALGWQLPPMSPPPTLTVAIDRNGFLRSADVDATRGIPALRALVRSHFDIHPRTVPFPEMLARDLDEILVTVTLNAAPGT